MQSFVMTLAVALLLHCCWLLACRLHLVVDRTWLLIWRERSKDSENIKAQRAQGPQHTNKQPEGRGKERGDRAESPVRKTNDNAEAAPSNNLTTVVSCTRRAKSTGRARGSSKNRDTGQSVKREKSRAESREQRVKSRESRVGRESRAETREQSSREQRARQSAETRQHGVHNRKQRARGAEQRSPRG
jgi:hypothetical protein